MTTQGVQHPSNPIANFDQALRDLAALGCRPGLQAERPRLHQDLVRGLMSAGLPLGRVYRASLSWDGASWQLRDDGPAPIDESLATERPRFYRDSVGGIVGQITATDAQLPPGSRPVVSLAWRSPNDGTSVTMVQIAAAPFLVRSTGRPRSRPVSQLFTDAQLHRALTGEE